MDGVAKDLIFILERLLPGFVAAWIFHNLTSRPTPSQFERVVQALIYSMFIQATVYIIKYFLILIGIFMPIFTWSQNSSTIWSIFVAIVFGISFSYLANSDILHCKLRRLQITRETSYPSEWFRALSHNITFLVLHLKDERRLYGWPIEWPSDPSKGHFIIEDPSWLIYDEDANVDRECLITGVKQILINSEDVKWIEFLEKTWEKNDGKQSTESAAAETALTRTE